MVKVVDDCIHTVGKQFRGGVMEIFCNLNISTDCIKGFVVAA